jgi:UPF0755 protein
MKKYTIKHRRKRLWKRFIVIAVVGLIVVVLATIAVRYKYNQDLKPLSSSQQQQVVTVENGDTTIDIANLLQQKELIRSAWAFNLYAKSKAVDSYLEAGTYGIAPDQSIPQIVSQITHGRVKTDLVTIFPGQRLDQVRARLIEYGFSATAVDQALNPANYANDPVLADKPPGASLEGYLYPQSYERTADTTPETIVQASLDQMQQQLTPKLKSAFAAEGLTVYQGITLASIVEQEVANQSDRDQVAQVFLTRLRIGMMLESNVTADYGATLAGAKPSSTFPSVYNTYLHPGLPPTPISNVDISSLDAVAYPANTDWLYFVAGDNGTTYFSTTYAQQEANVAQYCKQLCGQ